MNTKHMAYYTQSLFIVLGVCEKLLASSNSIEITSSDVLFFLFFFFYWELSLCFFKMIFYSFSPPAQSKKVFRNYELLVTEADGLWDLVRRRRVVEVWVSGGHLAELLFFC